MDCKKEQITDNVLQHVKKVMHDIKYGRITIELRESSDKVDVVVEQRQRFLKNEYKKG